MIQGQKTLERHSNLFAAFGFDSAPEENIFFQSESLKNFICPYEKNPRHATEKEAFLGLKTYNINILSEYKKLSEI
jgi:hypothetical protein